MLYLSRKNFLPLMLAIFLAMTSGCFGQTAPSLDSKVQTTDTLQADEHPGLDDARNNSVRRAAQIGLPLVGVGVVGAIIAYNKKLIQDAFRHMREFVTQKQTPDADWNKVITQRAGLVVTVNGWLSPILRVGNHPEIQLSQEDRAWIQELAWGQRQWSSRRIAGTIDLGASIKNQLNDVGNQQMNDDSAWRTNFVTTVQTKKFVTFWKLFSGAGFNPHAPQYNQLWEQDRGIVLKNWMDSIDRLARALFAHPEAQSFPTAKAMLLKITINTPNTPLGDVLIQNQSKTALFLYTLIMLKWNMLLDAQEQVEPKRQHISHFSVLPQGADTIAIEPMFLSSMATHLGEQYADYVASVTNLVGQPDNYQTWVKERFDHIPTDIQEIKGFDPSNPIYQSIAQLVFAYFYLVSNPSAEEQVGGALSRAIKHAPVTDVPPPTFLQGLMGNEEVGLSISQLAHPRQEAHERHRAALWLVSLIEAMTAAQIWEKDIKATVVVPQKIRSRRDLRKTVPIDQPPPPGNN